MTYMQTMLILFLFPCLVYAQQDSMAPHRSAATIAIKGKVLPWLLLGSGINYTVGFEYGFKSANSLGIELSYNDYSSPNDKYDSATHNDIPGPRVYTVSRGMIVYYRRYFNVYDSRSYERLANLLKSDYLPYAGIFVRYGKLDLHYEAGYVTDQVSYDEWQYSAGAVIGMVISVFDLNIGPFYKMKYVKDVERSFTGNVVTYHSSQPVIGVRVGANLIFDIKKGKHYLSDYTHGEY